MYTYFHAAFPADLHPGWIGSCNILAGYLPKFKFYHPTFHKAGVYNKIADYSLFFSLAYSSQSDDQPRTRQFSVKHGNMSGIQLDRLQNGRRIKARENMSF